MKKKIIAIISVAVIATLGMVIAFVPGEENARIEKLFRAEERLQREEDFLEMEKYLEQRNRE